MKSTRGVVGFVRTVEAGSFASAAKTLGITPVAVGKNVQRHRYILWCVERRPILHSVASP